MWRDKVLKVPPSLMRTRERKQDMVRKASWTSCALLGISLTVVGCGNAQKEATDAAINATQAAINTVQGEAAKYVPDQLHAAQAALQSARDALAKNDYRAALTAAQDAANKAKDLAAAAAAKKDEWTKTWTEVSATMPKSLNEVKARLDAYSHGAHRPAGMDDSTLADAKALYERLKQSLADASAEAMRGNPGDAINKMPAIKDMLAKLKEMLGIKS
jgi:hypothetical protein